MKRLTDAQSELIDAFLAEYPSRVSTAQLEKDLFISEAFAAFVAPVTHAGREARFVLCGGTAVSKVFRYTERISEDVDLRVVLPKGLSGAAERRFPSRVKAEVLQRLRGQGFEVAADAVRAGNGNRYMAIPVRYASRFPRDEALRPELLVEISARSPCLEPVVHGYDTMINQMLGRTEPAGTIACLDIRETLAGKNAALLRRWSARLRGARGVFEPGGTRDEDIVRHIYDLGCIFGRFPDYVTDEQTVGLAREILWQDAREFGAQDPAFREAPIEQALEALRDLREGTVARQWYERFTKAMVYGEIPAFDVAMKSVARFAEGWTS